MKLTKTYGYLKKDLTMIEEALNEAIDADHPVLKKASVQLLEAGGKRIRPVFVLLSARMGDYDEEKVKTVAVSLELIHMASLVHDDVIDDADLRRGKPTVKHTYDNKVAMYMGDFILARALENMTSISKPEVHRLLSHAMVELALGEVEQIKDKFNLDQNLRHYLRRIKRKTALLIATSCKLGAIVSDVPAHEARQLYKYGYYIGMSYQIIDDILDFTSNEKVLGKPAGHDLLQGHITLPILYAMEDSHFKHELIKAGTSQGHITSDHIDHLMEAFHQTDAIARSYALSDRYLQKAQSSLDIFPASKTKETMQNIAQFIGSRRS
ncbi:Heptaprenyl diphosphate synthase [Lentibacillus sp. JNUCC-1]|uniref:heptaprenyl diphosphate synthase component II n=1 Tax=Lentibacillus sp. JNUCC-1 TaxID=2654513 RepID=UPI0012E7D95F|nr:heptaprenyl diphosphate synthase component II [Lentibacillus sp. JNUCC-1]MUV39777.1 Heptaprenyl diphosphate synthase [Lentibacillus sp. JNUCC-1]